MRQILPSFLLAFLCLFVSVSWGQSPNGGIYQSYAILNIAGNNASYNLNESSNPNFDAANLGTFGSDGTLRLQGAHNKTFKCGTTDITNGKIHYRIYPQGNPSGIFQSISLNFKANIAGAGDGCQNQEWETDNANVNVLAGLCNGTYTLEVYTTADYQGAGTGTFFISNFGANYKATFTINNVTNSGIYESYVLLDTGLGTTFYDLNASTINPNFYGSDGSPGNLGQFCSSGGVLKLKGGQNNTFKCLNNDIINGKLYYRIYPGSTPSGSFIEVNLPFNENIDGAGDDCQNQTWTEDTLNTNLLTGLAAGTYTIEIYSQAGYTFGGTCPSIHYASNGGANYKATFTVVPSPEFTAIPNSPINANANANCQAVVNYTVTAKDFTSMSYEFDGATLGSGNGSGSGSTFNKGTTTVTVTIESACGIQTTSFDVVVNDTTPPTALCQNININLDENGVATITPEMIDNGSSDSCGDVILSLNNEVFTCADLASTPVASDLFISEYIEGSSNNKAIEIFNGTGSAVNLSGYSIVQYFNGSTNVGSTIPLSGTLQNGEVFVVSDDNASSTILAVVDLASTANFFNGDDAIALLKNGVVIDVIGQIGFDPGSEWGSGLTSTADNTIRRKSTIIAGDTDGSNAFNPSLEWEGFATDTFSGLGTHTIESVNNGTPVILTVSDGVNTSTCQAFVTVNDVTPPTFTTAVNALDRTVECGNTTALDNALALAPQGTDACGNVILTQVSDVITPGIGSNYTRVRTWKLTDASGNNSAQNFTQTIVVQDTTPPTFTTAVNNLNRLVECGNNTALSNALALAPQGTDNCGSVTLTQVSDVTTPGIGSNYIRVRTWKLTDASGNESAQNYTQTITYQDTTAPTAICQNITVNLSPDGTVTITPQQVDNGSNDSCSAVTVTINQNTFTCANTGIAVPTDLFISEYVEGSGNNKAIEIYNGTGSTVSLTGYSIVVYFNGATSGTAFPLTGSIQNGDVFVFASSASNTAILAQADQTTGLGLFTGDDAIELHKNGQPIDVIGQIGDDPGTQWGSGLTSTADNSIRRKSNIIIGDNNGSNAFDPSLEWNGFAIDTFDGLGSHALAPVASTTPVTLTVTDENNNTATCIAQVTVLDVTAPTITTPALALDATIACGDAAALATALALVPQATDACGTPSLQVVSDTTTNACGVTFTRTRIWNFKDASGNTSTNYTQTITVSDTTPPTIACVENTSRATQTNACSYTVVGNEFDATAQDSCSTPSLTWSVSGATTASGVTTMNGVVLAKGLNTITWTATDGCQLTNTCTFTVMVNDLTPPTITTPAFALDATIECGNATALANALALAPQATDACGVPSIQLVSDTVSNSCGTTFTQTRVWNFTDASGNTSPNYTQTITVTDTTPPTIVCVSATTRATPSNACAYTVVGNEFDATAQDGCSTPSLTWSVSGATTANGTTTMNGVVLAKGLNTITWVATDGCQLTNTCTFTVMVNDETPPTITTPAFALDATIECGDATALANALALAPQATDACGIANLNVVSDTTTNACGATYTQTRVWNFTDASGNTSANYTQVITVVDTTAPAITCANGGTRATNAGTCGYTVVGTEFDATAEDTCSNPSLTWSVSGATNANGVNTMAGVVLNYGLNTITWTATDACGLISTCTLTVDVDTITTVTTLTVAPASQQYSDSVTMTATITPYVCTGAPEVTGKVYFYVGNYAIGSAGIINGVATITVPLLEDQLYDADLSNPMNPTNGPLKPGVYEVTAVIDAAATAYAIADPTPATLTITKEDADLTYNGPTYFTANPNTLAGTVLLSNSVIDREDGAANRGDIRNATVTFRDGGESGTVLGTPNVPVGLVNPGQFQEGIATTSFATTLTSNESTGGGRIYEVWSGADNYYTGATEGPTTITLGMPGQDFVTGGGFVNMTQSAGTYAGTAGKKMNFGLVMKWNPSGKNIQGNVNVIFRRVVNGVTRVYQIKSNSITSLGVENVNNAGAPASGSAITFRRASIVTKANLRDITNPLSPVSLGGNLNLVVMAWESTTDLTGGSDRIGVQLTGSGSSGLLFSSNWVGGATQAVQLGGGKMQVRSSTSVARDPEAALQDLAVATPFEVIAYPNPTNHQFTIEVGRTTEQAIQPLQVVVYDLLGRVVDRAQQPNGTAVSFGAQLPAGVYTVEVSQGNQQKTLQLVKK